MIDPSMLIKILASALGFGGTGQFNQPRFYGQPGAFANTYSYRPGFLENLFHTQVLQRIAPGFQRTPPPMVSAADMQRIQMLTRMRSNIADTYSGRNTLVTTALQQMLTKTGIMQGGAARRFVTSINRNFAGKFVLGQLGNLMFGPSIDEMRAESAVDLHRFFSGYQFG